MEPKSDLIVMRMYHKGDQLQSVVVRELTGGDIDGSMFQFETWKNNVEDESLRETSGDIYHVRNQYFAKLLNLLEEGWKKQSAGVYGNPHHNYFNPEEL